jgi:hypothetical protein
MEKEAQIKEIENLFRRKYWICICSSTFRKNNKSYKKVFKTMQLSIRIKQAYDGEVVTKT